MWKFCEFRRSSKHHPDCLGISLIGFVALFDPFARINPSTLTHTVAFRANSSSTLTHNPGPLILGERLHAETTVCIPKQPSHTLIIIGRSEHTLLHTLIHPFHPSLTFSRGKEQKNAHVASSHAACMFAKPTYPFDTITSLSLLRQILVCCV